MRRYALVSVLLAALGAPVGWGQESRRIPRIPMPSKQGNTETGKIEDDTLPPELCYSAGEDIFQRSAEACAAPS